MFGKILSIFSGRIFIINEQLYLGIYNKISPLLFFQKSGTVIDIIEASFVHMQENF